jgi:hypothetical protein
MAEDSVADLAEETLAVVRRSAEVLAVNSDI